MEDLQTQWTKKEFEAYVLLYCSYADLKETAEETHYIEEKIKHLDVERIRHEFEQDNDFQSNQKIQSTLRRFKYSEQELSNLLTEIKELFLADGVYHMLERNMSTVFDRLIKQS